MSDYVKGLENDLANALAEISVLKRALRLLVPKLPVLEPNVEQVVASAVTEARRQLKAEQSA